MRAVQIVQNYGLMAPLENAPPRILQAGIMRWGVGERRCTKKGNVQQKGKKRKDERKWQAKKILSFFKWAKECLKSTGKKITCVNVCQVPAPPCHS